MQLFSVDRKHWMLFRNTLHFRIKSQQEIISNVGDVFIFYHFVLIDVSWILRIQNVLYNN